MSEKKTAKIILEIAWDHPDDLPSLWNWSLIKYPMDLTSVKYLGIVKPQQPEQSDSWMGN